MSNQIQGFQLSPQQTRLWLLQQVRQVDPVQCAIMFKGDLNTDKLNEVLQQITDRHEILRTTFHHRPGIRLPIQVIADRSIPELRTVDLQQQKSLDEAAYTDSFLQQERGYGFNYEQGPLVSALLLSFSTRRKMLLLTLPAVCADARTIGNIFSEICDAFAQSPGTGKVHDDPTQYVQFSEWQNQLGESEGSEAGQDYWQRLSKHALAPLSLSVDKNSRHGRDFSGTRFYSTIEGTTLARIEAITTDCGTSIGNFLLSCWQILLWRLTGHPHIRVAVRFDGREFEDLHGAMGVFSKQLPIDCHCSGDSQFQEVLQQITESMANASSWQDYFAAEESYETNGDGPGLSTAFEFEEWPAKRNVDGLVLALTRRLACGERYEVKLQCQRREQQLELEWHYDAGRLSSSEVERLAQQYATLVANACAHPETPIAELEVVSEQEREQLVMEWNRTETKYAEASVPELFEAQVERSPAAIAVVYEGATLSYAELDQRANQVAHYLQGQGIGAESIVGILLERSLELVVCMLGVLKAGAAYLPLDVSYPEARLSYMLADAGVQLLLTEEWLLERVSEANCAVLCVSKDAAVLAGQSSERAERRVSSENLAYVIYTSGSSGRPKGVMITQGAISNHMQWLGESYPLLSADRVLQKTPCSFDASVWEFYAPLLAGAALVLAQPGGQQDSKYLVELMREQQISIVQVVPSLLRLLLAEAELESCAQLRRVFSGGERLTEELAAQFWERLAGVELINLYGPTEATIDATHRRYETGEQWEGIGRPVGNMKCYLLDDKLQLVPVGAVGELWLGGAGLARGYLQRPELTAQKFVPDQYSGAVGARLYRTGDLARYGSAGELEYVGRADGQLKVRGYRIEVGEIEQRLRQHEEVQEAVVVGQGAVGRVERLVGYVVLRADSELQVEELRRHVGQELPDYMVPSGWMKLERLPLTASGKVDRLALPEPDFLRSNLKEKYVAPQTQAERIIDTIWQGVLQLEKISINDNFFDLGGHSLLMLQVHHQLDEAFERDVSIIDMFQYPTISSLATFLSRNGNEDSFIDDNQDRAENRKGSRKRQKEVRQEVRATMYQQQTSSK